ncbi:MAG: PD40 domain-containing protein [Chitinophagaceae bacterium]|nr:PD40 domain-containing protein [Chitinophagaceae bacterium]
MNKLLFLLLTAGFLPGAYAQKQYKIVYNVLEDREKDNYEIYSMNMDGSGQKNITGTPGVEWVYYAYKDKVYYISDADTCHRCYFLYEMDAEGNNKRKISALQLEDSWMSSRKNGTEMIVLGRIGKTTRNQLFLINLASGGFQQITTDTITTKRDPLFLPGGKEIVLPYRPDKAKRKTVPDELWKFSLEEKDGAVRLADDGVQLTVFPSTDTLTQWFEYHAGPPQWNSRHKFISYLSRQKGQLQVFAVTPDGKKKWQLTTGEKGTGWHSWSPDGKWLVMDKTTPDEKSYDIYLMNYKTKVTVQLTNSPKYEQAPVIVEVKK